MHYLIYLDAYGWWWYWKNLMVTVHENKLFDIFMYRFSGPLGKESAAAIKTHQT